LGACEWLPRACAVCGSGLPYKHVRRAPRRARNLRRGARSSVHDVVVMRPRRPRLGTRAERWAARRRGRDVYITVPLWMGSQPSLRLVNAHKGAPRTTVRRLKAELDAPDSITEEHCALDLGSGSLWRANRANLVARYGARGGLFARLPALGIGESCSTTIPNTPKAALGFHRVVCSSSQHKRAVHRDGGVVCSATGPADRRHTPHTYPRMVEAQAGATFDL